MKKDVWILLSFALLISGCVAKEEGPNLDVMWNVPQPAPENIPIEVTVLSETPPRDDGVLEKCYANWVSTAMNAGLGEVLALAAGEEIEIPDQPLDIQSATNSSKKNNKKAEGETAGLRKVNKEAITELALMSADLGIVALEKGNIDLSAKSLDIALQIMTSFGGNEKNLKKALSLWGSESMKEFKGEPHERAVVFFWRGLTYLTEGDLDNARACFRSANLEDEYAKDPDQRGNWIVADIMERQCSVWIGDGLEESLGDRMRLAYPGVPIPPALKDTTVVIVFALGYPPLKQAAGYHGSMLAYQRADIGAAGAVIVPSGQIEPKKAEPMEDIVMQAVCRGQRATDQKLDKMAKTKDNLKRGGDIMEQVGGQLPYIGILFQIGGQAMRGAAAKTKAFADTRSLCSIPSYVAVALMRPQDVSAGARLQILSEDGNSLAEADMPSISESSKPVVVIVRYVGFPYELKTVVDPTATVLKNAIEVIEKDNEQKT